MPDSDSGKRFRLALDLTLSWSSLAYGLFAVAIEPIRTHDDVQIVIGLEAVLLAVTGLLWAGHRRNLGVALIVLALAAPVVTYATAPLYWGEAELFGDAFWTTIGIGGAIGLPLLALGVYTVARARRAPPGADRWWMRPLRWLLQFGLIVIAVAFRTGSWDSGISLVYVGAAIILLALMIAVPRRIAIGRRGVGVLLIVLGLGTAGVVGVASAFLGGHISGDEAAVALLPAAVVAFVGLLLSRPGRRREPDRESPPTVEPGVSTENVDDAVIDLLPRL